MQKLLSVIALVVIASLVLSACGPAATPVVQVVKETVVVAGTPEEVADCQSSHTGRFLRETLRR